MIHAVPKPERSAPKPRKPLPPPKQWLPKSTKPLPPVNIVATAKRVARRARERNSAANKAARKLAFDRADGICECGCGQPFDKTWGQFDPDYPEFHHDDYGDEHTPPVGRAMRRQCHQFLERTKFSTRKNGRVN